MRPTVFDRARTLAVQRQSYLDISSTDMKQNKLDLPSTGVSFDTLYKLPAMSLFFRKSKKMSDTTALFWVNNNISLRRTLSGTTQDYLLVILLFSSIFYSFKNYLLQSILHEISIDHWLLFFLKKYFQVFFKTLSGIHQLWTSNIC